MLYLLIFFGKIISFLSFFLNLGSGSTWPGHLALKLDRNFLKKIIKKNPKLKIVFVTGTNGKTTTTAFIKYIFQKLGIKAFSNQEGANMLNGLASSLIKNSDFFGRINYQWFIFEVDEFNLKLLLKEIKPHVIIFLNLFRDQIDRYGEVDTIGFRWVRSLSSLDQKTTIILNGDDPYLFYHLGKYPFKKYFFGIKKTSMKKKSLAFDVDFHYCPSCYKKLIYQKISFSHLGDFYCLSCGLKRENIIDFEKEKIVYPLKGLYNQYNFNAALVFLTKYCQLNLKKINEMAKDFSPAFGRQENIFYQKRVFKIFLGKNPAGYNQALETIKDILKKKRKTFLFLLNDRIPDGKDVSWIWDIDIKVIFPYIKKLFISGERRFDMALRFKYDFFEKKINLEKDLRKIVSLILKNTKEKEEVFVVANYSAMLEIRKILVGRKLI